MTGAPDDGPVTAQPPASAHRSRWRRFSPSMGWRAFWSEIVIVVLGVVIALAANEAVQEWNWRNKVEDAEARLQGDITWVSCGRPRSTSAIPASIRSWRS